MYSKYLKYKEKYLKLKNQIGGVICLQCNKKKQALTEDPNVCNCNTGRLEDVLTKPSILSALVPFLSIGTARALKAAVPSENPLTALLQTHIRSEVVQVSAGGAHSLAILADGTIRAWGYDGNGQCTVPDFGGIEVVEVSAGEYHSLARLADGTVKVWGRNSDGQCTLPDFRFFV